VAGLADHGAGDGADVAFAGRFSAHAVVVFAAREEGQLKTASLGLRVVCKGKEDDDIT
jgi:hypothetical protein